MSKTHELKTWPEYFEPLWRGDKTFDVRYDDRGWFAVGDLLHLREWSPRDTTYTGREVTATIAYILTSAASVSGVVAGYVVMGIKVHQRASSGRIPASIYETKGPPDPEGSIRKIVSEERGP